ncbi:hypothetical protein CHBNV3_10440 [Haemophilus influenzae]|uniref:phage tail protein n=1 Tax=Haemophilus influenzae TaxID=727 RepID=UPI001C341CFF|nr:phage tail protein [Haemophilus influenzae]BBF16041.1 hypothetical protein CHBNV3_10440 [Haemophilus influenzae]
MASLITPQFERYVAEQTIARGTVQFDEFIFANIPGLNENILRNISLCRHRHKLYIAKPYRKVA